ncbi:MAG: hypothetical protein AAB425_07610, partial [Bdellovibrionota bacterium]
PVVMVRMAIMRRVGRMQWGVIRSHIMSAEICTVRRAARVGAEAMRAAVDAAVICAFFTSLSPNWLDIFWIKVVGWAGALATAHGAERAAAVPIVPGRTNIAGWKTAKKNVAAKPTIASTAVGVLMDAKDRLGPRAGLAH